MSLRLAGVRPLRLVILSKRAVPPSLILASRRSRRRRADLWAGDSSGDDMVVLMGRVDDNGVQVKGRRKSRNDTIRLVCGILNRNSN